ncbi:MAG: type VI secretion system ATPase TssH, partial [Leadbetterella sp.]
FLEAEKESPNAWSQYFKDEAHTELLENMKKVIRPEFLNRIDEIVLFDPLGKTDIRHIVELQMDEIKKRLQNQNITLEATDRILDHVTSQSYDVSFGARPLKRFLQKTILNQLSKYIINGSVSKDKIILADLDINNEIQFENVESLA